MTNNQWSERFKIGESTLDEHHEEVFKLISSLDTVILTHRRSNLEPVIFFLENYVRNHFSEEELIMQQHNFNGYDYHKTEHDIFKIRIQAIRKAFDDKKPNAHVIFLIRKFVDRLVHHIIDVDSQISEIIHA